MQTTERVGMWQRIGEVVNNENSRLVQDVENELMTVENNLVERHKIAINHYGFQVEREVLIDRQPAISRVKEKLSKSHSFVKNQTALAEKMVISGLSPIAVLPTSLFNDICAKMGLYRFENLDKNGQTSTDESGSKNIFELFSTFAFFLSVTAILSIVAVSCGGSVWCSFLIAGFVLALFLGIEIGFEKFRDRAIFLTISLLFLTLTGIHLVSVKKGLTLTQMLSQWYLLIVFYVAAVVIFFAMFMCVGLFFYRSNNEDGPGLKLCKIIFNGLINVFVRHATPRCLMSYLWPNGVDVNNPEGEKVTVRFPEAPAEFTERLLKMDQLDLRPLIAVAPEAIVINRKEVALAKKREIAKFKDPVLYYNENGLTAVLSQFGDFPDEEKVIEWVKQVGLTAYIN